MQHRFYCQNCSVLGGYTSSILVGHQLFGLVVY